MDYDSTYCQEPSLDLYFDSVENRSIICRIIISTKDESRAYPGIEKNQDYMPRTALGVFLGTRDMSPIVGLLLSAASIQHSTISSRDVAMHSREERGSHLLITGLVLPVTN